MSSKLDKTEKDDLFLDNALRPAEWDEYIGQKIIKDNF